MKAPYESGIKKDFPENATEWIATGGKRCTDAGDEQQRGSIGAPFSTMKIYRE